MGARANSCTAPQHGISFHKFALLRATVVARPHCHHIHDPSHHVACDSIPLRQRLDNLRFRTHPSNAPCYIPDLPNLHACTPASSRVILCIRMFLSFHHFACVFHRPNTPEPLCRTTPPHAVWHLISSIRTSARHPGQASTPAITCTNHSITSPMLP